MQNKNRLPLSHDTHILLRGSTKKNAGLFRMRKWFYRQLFQLKQYVFHTTYCITTYYRCKEKLFSFFRRYLFLKKGFGIK